jgi:hypothetical protein
MSRERLRQRETIWQTHWRYDQFRETWILLGEVLEGDGGFMDGTNLVAHPREINYGRTADGRVNHDIVVGEKEKYRRRKALARYENFGATLVDTFVDYQYAKEVIRVVENDASLSRDLTAWWKDVDGDGTPIDDWLKRTQVLADTYGHVHVLLDRQQRFDRESTAPKSRAEEGPLVLRTYIPLDTLDWLAPHGRMSSVKFVEAVDRKSLFESWITGDARLTGSAADHLPNVEFRIWTESEWAVYDVEGARITEGVHAYGEVPVVTFYARRRPRIPLIGRSLLGDGRLFKDHFNLVSELREQLRQQCFALLNIQLQPDEDIADARGRLGDHLGSDSILWSRGLAQWLATPNGPAELLMQEISNCERKIYRLAGLPWESDSLAAEAAESRRIKAQDLNRLLAGHADSAQWFEQAIVKKWCIGMYGRDAGLARYAAAGVTIKHPDEFHTEEMVTVLENTRASIDLDLGPIATSLIKQRALPIVLPDLPEPVSARIMKEIEEQEAKRRALEAAFESAPSEPEEASDTDEEAP